MSLVACASIVCANSGKGCNASAVQEHNAWVYSRFAFGSMGTLVCMVAMADILAHNRDKDDLRHRILLGLFTSNLLYSIANIVPRDIFNAVDDPELCGKNSLALFREHGPATYAKGFWIACSYCVLFYEIYVVWASVFAMKGIKQNKKAEVATHFFCAFTSLVVCIVFVTKSIELGENTDQSDAYFVLVSTMLQIWIGLSSVLVLTYIYQRVLYHKLRKAWDANLQDTERVMNIELWDTQNPYVQEKRIKKRKLLDLQKRGFEDITRPLEPYIIVFSVFLIPAIVMATDWCADVSDNWEYYGCDIVCESILSLRTVCTVGVYLFDRERRKEALDIRTVSLRLMRRIVNCHKKTGVRFSNQLENVRTISSDDVTEPPVESEQEVFGRHSYKLMSDDVDEQNDTKRLL